MKLGAQAEDIAAATRLEAEKLAEILGSAPVGSWGKVCCGNWTVDQVAGHLGIVPSTIQGLFQDTLEGVEIEPFDVTSDDFQEAQLDLIGEGEPTDRLEAVLAAYGAFADFASSIPAERLEEPVWTPEGVMPLGIGLCIPLNELVVHGWDIRCCLGGPRELDAGSAELLVPYVMRALSAFVAPDALVRPLSLNVSGQHWTLEGGPRGVEVEGGGDPEASLQAPSLKADPATFVLFAWGRITLDEARVRGMAVNSDGIRLLDALRPF